MTAQDRGRLLADFAAALAGASTDLEQVLSQAVRMASELIGDGVVVRLVNDREVFDRVAVHHPDPAAAEQLRRLLPRLEQRADEGFIAQVRRAGEIVVRNDLDEAAMRDLAGPLASYPGVASLGAALMAPLYADGRFLGTMSLSRNGRDRPYTAADVDLAADVAARVALAVAVARSVAEVRAERESYAQIVQTCAEGVWKVDGDGCTTFANERLAEMLGVTVPRLTGRPAAAWMCDGHAEPWWRLDPGRPHEVRLRRGDGQPIWAQVSVSPLPAGAPGGWLAMVTDITDRVRSRELGERLAQMQRLDSVGQLAGGIAHDFNNLLSIIGGAVELMLAEVPAGSSAAALAQQVGNAVEQGAALTRQLLAFGRGSPGREETIDVHEVITELAPMLHRTLGEHIELRIPAAGDVVRPCRVRMDQGQLHQVIVNLAGNARDAMNAGGRLSIDCDHLLVDRAELGDAVAGVDTGAGLPGGDDKAWFVRLAVSDTGTGMDAATLRQAFEPFYTTKPPGQGTGLGLAGVYGIVRAAGGLVRLYSESGHGCTVKVYLPATDEPPGANVAARTPARSPRQASKHILVVEDNPALAEVVKRLLQPAGYVVTVALAPAAALTVLDAGGPAVDVVITDVVMPDLTGPELAGRIRADRPGMPIVYTSGYTSGVLGERAHLTPDAILVEKPFTRVSLLEAIDRALKT